MPNKTIIEKQFSSFEQHTDGLLGISACHIESNETINFRADELFLMCSTYKIPIAIHFLSAIEKKLINIDELYIVEDADLRTGYAFTLNEFDYSAGFPISLRNLLLLMLRESCNTSTDILLRVINGPKSVTSFLRSINIHDMSVDRYTLEILANSDGIKTLPENHKCTLKQYKALELSVSHEEREQAKKNFALDKQDKATPTAMTQLLLKLFKNEILTKQYTDWLLKTMQRNKLYPNRLMGLLPPKTPVAHKTGTATGYTNDVGIITLPHNLGHVAISVFIKQSSRDKTHNERVIAEVSRIAYDYFLLK